jgi:hypothetical protein
MSQPSDKAPCTVMLIDLVELTHGVPYLQYFPQNLITKVGQDAIFHCNSTEPNYFCMVRKNVDPWPFEQDSYTVLPNQSTNVLKVKGPVGTYSYTIELYETASGGAALGPPLKSIDPEIIVDNPPIAHGEMERERDVVQGRK